MEHSSSSSDHLSDHERLNRLPPPSRQCASQNCYSIGEEDEDLALQRCSTCKDAFYCNRTCQTKGWKKHKYGCSLLPVGQLAYSDKMDSEEYKQLDEEVRRISLVLQEWVDAAEPFLTDSIWIAPREWPPNQTLQDIKLSPAFSEEGYTRAMQNAFATHLARVVRLILVHLLASPPPSHPDIDPDDHLYYAKTLEKMFDGAHLPPSWTQFWGPKIVCRPRELSPAEYLDMIVFLAMLELRPGRSLDGEESELETREERAFQRRFLNLSIIDKRLHL